MAARLEKEAVDMTHFEQAIDRVIGGLEKKNKVGWGGRGRVGKELKKGRNWQKVAGNEASGRQANSGRAAIKCQAGRPGMLYAPHCPAQFEGIYREVISVSAWLHGDWVSHPVVGPAWSYCSHCC